GPGEVLDLVDVQLLAVPLADLVDQPELQRKDGEVGQPIGKQLQRAGEHRLLEDALVQRGVARAASGQGAGGGRGGRRARLVLELVSGSRAETERSVQRAEEGLLGGIGWSVHAADCQRNLVGGSPCLRVGERGGEDADALARGDRLLDGGGRGRDAEAGGHRGELALLVGGDLSIGHGRHERDLGDAGSVGGGSGAAFYGGSVAAGGVGPADRAGGGRRGSVASGTRGS